MKNKLSLPVVATCIASIAIFLVAPRFATAIEIEIRRLPQIADSALYDIHVSGLSFSDNAVGPSGHVYKTFSGDSIFSIPESQVYSEIIGNWKINAAAIGPPAGIAEIDQFTVASFVAADLFQPAPSIVSPLDGSTVPANFVLQWQWPNGVTPPNGHEAISRGGAQGATVHFGEFAQDSIPISVQFSAAVTLATYSLRGGSYQTSSALVSAITSSVSPPKYGAVLGYGNLSNAVTVTVLVPEPSSFLLLAGGGAILCSRRRL